MNFSLFLAVVVPILGHALAMDNPNPECSDLGKLTKALENTIAKLPKSKVVCKTNTNCTGLQCSGKVRDRPFNGTVIVEGCHEPVRLLIHANGRRLYVQDGYERTILKKPIKLVMHVNLKKTKNVVYVTLQLKTCLVSSACIPVPLLNKQKIRVRCNGSQKANQSGGDPNPTSNPNPSDSTVEATGSSGKPSKNQPSIRSRISEMPILGHPLAMDNPNPECSDLGKLTKALENTIAKVPNSKVVCKTNTNCTGLQCSGKVRDMPFNGTVIVEGCHEPVRMLIHVNGRSLYVQDGYERTILKKPIQLNLHVILKKTRNVVYVTLKVKTCLISSPCVPLTLPVLKDQKIRVHCNGSQKANQSGGDPNANPNPSDSGEATGSSGKSSKNQPSIRSKISESNGKSLSSGAIAGIIIAAVVFVILIALIVWIVQSKRRRIQRYNDVRMNDGSDPLFFNSDPLA